MQQTIYQTLPAITPMRTSDLNCLLCLTNKATKTNSHIVPKFMTKNLLGQGNQKRAYTIGTHTGDKPPKYEQDSPKEDFILCPDCESYFSVLETYINERVHRRLWDIRKSADFTEEVNAGGVKWKSCLSTETKTFQLFIYSIIWRCSISSTALFNKFKIDNGHEEGVRKSLHAYKAITQSDLLSIIKKSEVLFPAKYVLMTCEKNLEPTKNVLMHMTGNKNPYTLILNEYMLILSFIESEKQQGFQELNNSIPTEENVKIGFLKEETWDGHRQSLNQFVFKKTIENLEKDGKKPFLMDENKLK